VTCRSAIINNVTYIQQKVPTLYTALSAGNDAWNPKVYGKNTNPFVVKNGQVIEVIINNHDVGPSPSPPLPAFSIRRSWHVEPEVVAKLITGRMAITHGIFTDTLSKS